MSIIEGFSKVWPFLRRYQARIYLSFLFAALVGIFWGANLSVVFPVSTVLMEGNLQDYVDQKLVELQEQTEASQAQVSALDEELKSNELSDTQRVRKLETRAENQEHIARAMRNIHWLDWAKTHVLPWIPHDQFNTVALLFGILVFATAVKGVCVFIQNFLICSVVELTTIDIRKACFRKCLQLDYQSLSLEGTPALMSRFTFDLQELSRGLTLVGGRMAREPIKAISCLGLAFMVNWRLTILSLVFVPVAGYMFYRFGKMLKQASHRMMDSMSRIYQVLEETLNAMRVVIAFGNGNDTVSSFTRKTNGIIIRRCESYYRFVHQPHCGTDGNGSHISDGTPLHVPVAA